MIKSFKNVKELEAAVREREKSGWNLGELRIMLQTWPIIIRQNEEIIKLLKRGNGNTRKLSKWNKFARKGLLMGLDLKTIAAVWNEDMTVEGLERPE